MSADGLTSNHALVSSADGRSAASYSMHLNTTKRRFDVNGDERAAVTQPHCCCGLQKRAVCVGDEVIDIANSNTVVLKLAVGNEH